MRDLLNLTQLINKKGSRIKSVLFDKDLEQGLEQKFFHLINSGKLHSDIEAAEILYQSQPDDPRYKILKSRVKKKILNHLYFLNGHQHGEKELENIRAWSLKYLYLSEVLFKEDRIDLAEKVLKKCFDLSEGHRIIDILMAALKLEIKIHGERGNRGLMKRAYRKLNDIREISEMEDRADYLFHKGNIIMSGGNTISLQKKKRIINILDTLKSIAGELNSIPVFIKYYFLSVRYFKCICDFQALENFCNKVPDIVPASNRNTKLFDWGENEYYKVYARYKTNTLCSDHSLINNLLNCKKNDPDKKHRHSKTVFQIGLQQNDIDLSKKALDSIYIKENWKRLNNQQQLEWQINAGYYNLQCGTTPFIFSQEQYINKSDLDCSEIPEYLRIHLNLLELVNLINNRRFSEALKNIDYLSRTGLKNKAVKKCNRKRSFQKLILIIKKANFDYHSVKTRGRYLHRQLKKGMLCKNGFEDHEIIPFERMWDYILLSLQYIEKDKHNQISG